MGVSCQYGCYQYGSDLLLWMCLINMGVPCYYGCVLSIWVCLVTMDVSYQYGSDLLLWVCLINMGGPKLTLSMRVIEPRNSAYAF